MVGNFTDVTKALILPLYSAASLLFPNGHASAENAIGKKVCFHTISIYVLCTKKSTTNEGKTQLIITFLIQMTMKLSDFLHIL
jgi:hypothetical protein